MIIYSTGANVITHTRALAFVVYLFSFRNTRPARAPTRRRRLTPARVYVSVPSAVGTRSTTVGGNRVRVAPRRAWGRYRVGGISGRRLLTPDRGRREDILINTWTRTSFTSSFTSRVQRSWCRHDVSRSMIIWIGQRAIIDSGGRETVWATLGRV